MVILEDDVGLGKYNMKYVIHNGSAYEVTGSLVMKIPYANVVCTDTDLHNTYPYNIDMQIALTMQKNGYGKIIYNDSQIKNDSINQVINLVEQYQNRKK